MKRQHRDPLLSVASSLERWAMMVTEFGAESINYQNGDSSIFRGNGWVHFRKMKADLRRALAAHGVAREQQLHAIHSRKLP